eukprot:5845308-Prymnesium_polylepis.2
MAKQYNMYNVQLSEFWKQRVGKEALHNAPYLDDDDMSQLSVERAPSRAPSELSVTSETSRAKVGSPSNMLCTRRQYDGCTAPPLLRPGALSARFPGSRAPLAFLRSPF